MIQIKSPVEIGVFTIAGNHVCTFELPETKQEALDEYINNSQKALSEIREMIEETRDLIYQTNGWLHTLEGLGRKPEFSNMFCMVYIRFGEESGFDQDCDSD